ncbi:MAG: nucleoside-diphosphate sugar epimerase/dehydratase [Chloroflexota bacterium]|nr:nucleoside-diphosphate sugar epimerase/dehydratase [Chloroflexota bacterium]
MRKSIERALARYGLLILLDALAVAASYGLALLLRFDWRVPHYYSSRFLEAIWILVIAYCAVNGAWRLYSRLWQYASVQEVVTIAASGAMTTIIILIVEILMYVRRPVPLSVVVAGGIFTTGAFVIVRYHHRLLVAVIRQLGQVVGGPDRRRVLIVGAGEAGQLLAWQLQHHDHRHEYELVGFVDDDPRKQGMIVHGLMVLGNREDIPQLARRRRVDLIIIAIHRISGPQFREILSRCQQTEARIKVLPDVLDLLKQPAAFPPVRDVELRDLLGRQEVPVDEEACQELLRDKVVLITGACGSIGSELCRQIARFEPKKLLLVDNNETGLHNMRLELDPLAGNQAAYIIADVANESKMETIIAREAPQIIFHAAAYKHVPLMEAHPEEAVRVNVKGTRILCQLAQQHGVERFVLISTDKAVHPAGVMGLSKRIGELLILALNSSHNSLFTAVRFGNVLGSRGSVALTFARQIAQGGPVTVTDERMSRYFMTHTEAVSLIIQAATLTQGGDIFLLDMGQEIKIVDLARKMIRLQGLRVGKDVDIIYTGIRPGEKLREEPIYEGLEEREPTQYPGIFRLPAPVAPVSAQVNISLDKLLARIGQLELLASDDQRAEMRQIVDEFGEA